MLYRARYKIFTHWTIKGIEIVLQVYNMTYLQGLEGSIEKTSPSLGRNAQYTKKSLISRLPGYLTVQYVRFFYGRAGESEETVSKKILKVNINL